LLRKSSGERAAGARPDSAIQTSQGEAKSKQKPHKSKQKPHKTKQNAKQKPYKTNHKGCRIEPFQRLARSRKFSAVFAWRRRPAARAS
jgi:hypothetical protein